MRNFLSVAALVIAAAATVQTSTAKDYSSFVNPMIGTDNHGHVAVGGSVPFGLVMMGPVNMKQGWDWCSGYCVDDNTIIGFSPIHLSGTGCCDLGDIIFMPTTGGVNKWRGSEDRPNSGHSSLFRHETETAEPGYYSVVLDRWNIKAEMTATPRVGWQRYTWPKGTKDQRFLIDLHNSIEDRATDCEIAWVDDHTICGHRTSTGWASRHTVYFVAEFSKPIKEWRVFEDDREQPGKSLRSTNAYGEIKFDSSLGDEVVVKLAISGASVEGAMSNLKAEAKASDTFDGVKAAARQTWNEWLGLVDAEFTCDDDQVIFYTALYHMMLTPWLYCDANGEYAGSDKRVHKTTDFKNYTTWSTWDTYRAFHPLATLILPQMQRDWARSILAVTREQPIIVEGIHGLNEKLSEYVPHSRKYKIYISALTSINIDEHNRIPTTDARLLRRMVRDAMTRGSDAARTIGMWPSVRRGEEENIFPFQEEADAMFNSVLIYELACLKPFAEPLLFQIGKDSPSYYEAKRLLKFLDYFLSVPSEFLPNNSICREFVGGSCFRV